MESEIYKRLEIKLVLGVILIDLLFAFLAIVFLVNSRSHALNSANLTAQNLVQLLEQRISDKARLVDDAIARVERAIAHQLASGGIEAECLERILESEKRQLPEIDAMRVTNAAGDVIYGRGITSGAKISYADRDFFKAHLLHKKSDLIVSEPIIGKISGSWILSFSRGYHTGDGLFAGVVTAAVPVDTFENILAPVNLGPTDTVVMRYADMGLIAQAPPVAEPHGVPGSKQISSELADLLKSGTSVATYQTAHTPDAVMRTYAFRRVSGWPFTIAVGLVDEKFLAPWKIQAMWVSALLAIFFLGTGIFVRTSVRHLRARAAMEKAHAEDMRRWRILIEQSRDGIVVLDQQGKAVEVNQCFAEMLGYTVAEAQQLHVWEWDTTWSREQLLTMIAQVDASGAQFATRHRRKDGVIIDVEISTNGTSYAGQKLIFCVCRDITERNLAEQTIREKEQLLRTLINSTPDLICFKDGKGRWLEANDADLHLFSLTGVNYKGKTDAELAEMTPPIYRESFLACQVSDEQSWQAGIVTRGEETITRVDGTKKTYDMLKSPIFEADGSRKGLVVLGRDITERKQLEEEKKGLVKQLIQAQKMEAIGTLAGGIAHDFNNILGAIIGYSEMIHDDQPKDSTIALYIAQVLKAADRAKDLVKQILAFSRQSETDKVPLQPVVIVNEAVKLLRASLPSTISIEKDVDPEVGFVLADPTQLHQIVMNLCTNAFHAMERDGGILTVSLRGKEISSGDLKNNPHMQPGNYVQLLINDTGEGIPPELLDKIFDPFFTTKEVGKGTGMGLAMVHGIVQSSGGSITCHSRVGKGTTFEVLLPTIEAGCEQPTAAVDIIAQGKEHILFIDDEEMLVEMGKTMLERLGYRVTTSTDSMEALLAFEKMPESYDLVITDQTMPKITGLELARRLLKIRPDIPVILCTGYSNVISEDLTKSAGIRGFAMKPLAKKDVAKLVRQLLDEAQ